MIATAVPSVKDQKIIPLGLIDSESVNRLEDLVPSLNETVSNIYEEKNDFINIFICHLLFYMFFCITLLLHIFIDFGVGTFIKNKFLQLIKILRYSFDNKNTAIAWFETINKVTYHFGYIRNVMWFRQISFVMRYFLFF